MKRAVVNSLLLAVVVATGAFAPAPEGDPDALMQEFETLCLLPEGDHDLTWAWAVHKGYEPLLPADFEQLQALAFARDLRGMRRVVDGIEYRVLAARGSIAPVGTDQRGFYSLCWVSASPGDYRQMRRRLDREFRVPSFVQGNSRVFPWIETPEGREPIRRARFESRQLGPVMQDNDVRMITLGNSSSGQVMIGYMRKREPDADDVDFFRSHGRSLALPPPSNPPPEEREP